MTRGLILNEGRGLSDAETVARLELLYSTESRLRADKGNVGLYSLTAGANGGSNPAADAPWSLIPQGGNKPPKKRSDCIGTAFWARGVDRYQPQRFAHLYGGWCNTNSILFDAIGERALTGAGALLPPQKLFRPGRLRPGAWIVYGSKYLRGAKLPGYGHILTVVEIDASIVEQPVDLFEVADKITVVHCHGGLRGRTQQAIDRETLHKAIGKAARRAHVIELVS